MPVSSFRFADQRRGFGQEESGLGIDPEGCACQKLDDFLESIPTLFGRLIQLGGAIDRSTGVYRPLIRSLTDLPKIGDAMAKAHERIFLDWLSQSLAFQVADMAAFVRRAGGVGQIRLQLLLAGRGWCDVLPAGLCQTYREHFRSQVELVAPLVERRL